MRVVEIIEQVRDLDAQLVVEEGHLVVHGYGEGLPADLWRALVEHKAELLAALAGKEADWRVATMRRQVPAAGPIPTLAARPDLSFKPGCCTSCGEPLPAGDRYRCSPCVEAAWIVLREVRAIE